MTGKEQEGLVRQMLKKLTHGQPMSIFLKKKRMSEAEP